MANLRVFKFIMYDQSATDSSGKHLQLNMSFSKITIWPLLITSCSLRSIPGSPRLHDFNEPGNDATY